MMSVDFVSEVSELPRENDSMWKYLLQCGDRFQYGSLRRRPSVSLLFYHDGTTSDRACNNINLSALLNGSVRNGEGSLVALMLCGAIGVLDMPG